MSISTIDLPARGWLPDVARRGHFRRVLSAGEPGVLRLLAALAVLMMAVTGLAATLSFGLARQADDRFETERRQALVTAIEGRSAGASLNEHQLLQRLEQSSGLQGLRLESEPLPGERVQSLLDRNGRIVGWLTWEPERPATAMLLRLLPLGVLIVVGLASFAALAIWQIRRLGSRLARSEHLVQQLAYEDILTGLPNHSHFFGKLDRAIADRHGNEALALATLDLDGFDEVNDALGYAGADQVLREIGRRLRDALPPSAMVARLGSDEFALAITGKNAEVASFVTDTVRRAIGRPIGSDPAVQIGVSVGLAVAPQDGTTRDELSRRAELALRSAKRRGRGITVHFDSAMEVEFQERTFIKREVANALAERKFEVHYQPIVRADGGALAGVEALLRWHHPERGAVPPSLFVPVAEEAGLMDRLGELVLRRAVADAARWRDLYVSVNLSPVQVRSHQFADVVSAVLKESGLTPSRLVLEMTEGVLIDNPDDMSVRLSRLRGLGVQLALDDFGAGYSSLSYLQTLPFDKLKVDRSFVTALERSANGGVLIQAVVALGRALGKGIVVEGVETEEQRVLLRLAGCHEMQGFLFAKAMPAEGIDQLLSDGGSINAAARARSRLPA